MAPKQSYRSSPLLLKPGKRTIWQSLPSALHISAAVSASLLIFAIINICVYQSLGPRNPWTKLVQNGCMMAMLTALILATPNLGNSMTKAFQRICGVMIGGWLFFGLYAACQYWWFLTICLAVWAFLLVSLSFLLTGREFLFPVALVTAFIVATNFDSVHQALVMTAVKTVAISGSIVLYTILSLLLFPSTATKQILTELATILEDLHQLAGLVLLTGPNDSAAAADDGSTDQSQHTAALTACSGDAAAVDDAGVGGSTAGGKDAAQAGASGKGNRKRRTAAVNAAACTASRLAADAAHRLHLVQQLLPMCKKERYIGSWGTYRCFIPSVRPSGLLRDEEVLAVVLNASQVLRVLVSVLAEYGAVPLAKRPPPASLVQATAQQLVQPLAESGVAALQDIAAALPVMGPALPSVPLRNIQSFSDVLQQLVSATVSVEQDAAAAPPPPQAAGPGSSQALAGNTTAAASSVAAAEALPSSANRWQRAAAAAGGLKLPQKGPEQLVSAFSALLAEAVTSEQGQMARWCCTLVLAQQLRRAVAGLNDSVSELLQQLPWKDRLAA